MIALILVLLVILTALFTTIQTLYVESMRLRTRDLPAMSYFKEVLEVKLKTRTTEEGALTFSFWKHVCMVMMGVLLLSLISDSGPIVPLDFLEALPAALLLTAFSAYLIPQLLYRRSSGHWMLAFVPFFAAAAIIIRPFVILLNFLHSLLDIV